MTVTKPLNKSFADAVYYPNYRLIQKATRYDDDVANELDKLTNKTAV